MIDEETLMGLRDGQIACAAAIGYTGDARWAAGLATLAFALSLVLAWRRFA